MSSAAGAANRAFGLDRGMPFPLSDIAEADVVVLVGSNPADTMPPAMQYFDAGRERGRPARRRRPPAHGDRPQRRPAPAAAAGHRPGAGQRAAAHRAGRGAGRRGVRRRAHHRLRGGAGGRRRVLARPGRAADRRPGRRPAAHRLRPGPGREGDHPHRPRRRAAPQRHRHRPGLDQPGARPRPARPPGQRLGHRHRPGQRAGRPRARAEGRPAARLPVAEGPGRPRARRRRLGDRPRRPADARASRAFELLDALGTDGGVRTLLVLASNVAVSAPDARRVISRLGDLDFLAVSDFFLSETAELADVVLPSAMWAEEDGTMTNLEGRVIRRRKALDPPTGVPDDLQLLATLAERLGAGRQVQRRPRDGLRGAAPGQRRGQWPTTPASATAGSTTSRASSGRARHDDPPRHAAAVRRPVRHPRRPGAVPARRARRRPRAARRRLPVRAHHRPGDGPVPVGHPDPAHPQPVRWSRPPRGPSCTPTSPGGSASARTTSSS